jgi:hypothetical protein
MLDIESVYWVSFRIIKCLRKFTGFKKNWGAKFDISLIRNEVLEHFFSEKSGYFDQFSLSLPKKGPIYRDNNANEDSKTVYDHLTEFLTNALKKLPDRTEELKELIRSQTKKSKQQPPTRQ